MFPHPSQQQNRQRKAGRAAAALLRDGLERCYEKLWVPEAQLGGLVEEEPVMGMDGAMSPGWESLRRAGAREVVWEVS